MPTYTIWRYIIRQHHPLWVIIIHHAINRSTNILIALWYFKHIKTLTRNVSRTLSAIFQNLALYLHDVFWSTVGMVGAMLYLLKLLTLLLVHYVLTDCVFVQIGASINNIFLQQIALCVLILLPSNLIEPVEPVRKLLLNCGLTTYITLTPILSLVLLTVKAIHNRLLVISKLKVNLSSLI